MAGEPAPRGTPRAQTGVAAKPTAWPDQPLDGPQSDPKAPPPLGSNLPGLLPLFRALAQGRTVLSAWEAFGLVEGHPTLRVLEVRFPREVGSDR